MNKDISFADLLSSGALEDETLNSDDEEAAAEHETHCRNVAVGSKTK